MSDTPITDAAEFDFNEDCTPEDNMVVASCDMRNLERELNEANRSITEAKTHLQEVDLPDEPIDIQAKRLRDAHDWQAGIAAGYEKQIQAANETLRKLNDALDEANADRLRLREAINSAISYANGRESEWGSRAEESFQYLYNALTTPPQPVVAKADADALAEALQKATDECLWRSDSPIPLSEEDSLRLYNAANEALETYRSKYPQ